MNPDTITAPSITGTVHRAWSELTLTGLDEGQLRAVLATYATTRGAFRTPPLAADGVVVKCEGSSYFGATTPPIEPARAAQILAALAQA